MGELLTSKDLPKAGTSRWVSRRKAQVIVAINGGLLTVDEACERYRLSLEELASWQRAYNRAGLPALRATRAQFYRDKPAA